MLFMIFKTSENSIHFGALCMVSMKKIAKSFKKKFSGNPMNGSNMDNVSDLIITILTLISNTLRGLMTKIE